MDSNLSFCEVKHKTNKGRTKKKRMELKSENGERKTALRLAELHDQIQAAGFELPYPVEILNASLETIFDRITLVNFEKTERLTIDCNLVFQNYVSGNSASMDPLVVMELKQDGRARSLFKEVLFDLRIKPYKISKYCIGTCMTRPEVKQNRFKKKLRRIDKLKSQES